MKPHASSYVPGLDLLRFFAAAIVTVYHLAFWAWAFPNGQVAQASLGVSDFHEWANVTSSGWAGVQIFFVISGFVIATSSERTTALRFVVSRIVRLGPAVWVCATITLLAWLAIRVGDPKAHLVTYVRSVLFMPTAPWIDSVYWTLGVEVAFYTSIFLLLAMQRFDWLKPMSLVLGVISTLFWIGFTYAAQNQSSELFAFFRAWQWARIGQLSLLQHGVFFAMGVVLWLKLVKHQRNLTPWIALFALGGCLQIAAETIAKLEKTGLHYSPALPCAMWLGAVGWIWLSVLFNSRVQRLPEGALQALRRLGLMTYPLYLLHNVAGGALMGTLAANGLPTDAALWLSIGIVLALCWWVSRFAEPALQKATRAVFNELQQRLRTRRLAPLATVEDR